MAQKKYKILLIEDDFEDADLLMEYIQMLSSTKINVVHVTSLKKGILEITENKFDLILTDLNLPDSFGLETLKTLCDIDNKTPVIVLTGLNDNETGLAAVEMGAQDFLVKGKFNDLQLLHSIQYAISRRKVEDQLRSDQNLLFKIFNNTPVVLFLVDKDRHIIKINNIGVSTIGKSEKEILGLRGGDVMNCLNHFNSPQGCGFGDKCQMCLLQQTVDKSFATKESFQNIKTPMSIVANDKVFQKQYLLSTSYIEADHEAMILVGLNDITELQEAKEQIKENSNRLETQLKISEYKAQNKDELLNFSLEQALLLTKSELGFIALYNEETQHFKIHSWSESAMKECEIENKIYEYYLQETGCWSESIRRRETFYINDFEKENPLIKGIPKGHVKLRNYLSVPFFYENKIVAVVSVSNKQTDYDYTDGHQLSLLMDSIWRSMERENLISDLKIAKERAEESDRLKSAFLANMSHEIRTPMNSIMGFIDLLQNDDNLSEENRGNFLDIVKQSSERLLDTINDIIEVSRIEAGHLKMNPTNVYLPDLVNYLYSVFKPEVEKKGLQFSIYTSSSLKNIYIETDKNKLESILINYIKNAIKFTREGSIELGCSFKNNEITFYVKDSGVGIPQNKLHYIFERFGQIDDSLNRSHEGSGLGLSIVKAYAELLGGSVSIDSEYGLGSTFFFHLPNEISFNGEEKNSKKEDAGGIEKQQLNHKILIAEDEDVNYMLLEQLLKKEGRSFLRAKNGLEAVRIFEENQDIDFIFMDIKMPVMDGMEATNKIRIKNKKVPIVALTAYALSGDRENFISQGCTDYLSKPVKKKDVNDMLNNYFIIEEIENEKFD